MTWFKVDDGFYSHEKVLTIPRAVRAEAIGTWTLCGTWSADKDRDGYVPTHMIEELGATLAGASALVDAKLWRRQRTGFVFVNWKEFQPTREEKAAKRLAESQRKAEYRARKAQENAAVSGNVPAGQNRDDVSPVPDPYPTRPVPVPDPNTEREGADAPRSPFCPKHPQGTDKACRACGNARMAYELEVTVEKNKPTPIPKRAPECAKHPGYPAGNCRRCDEDEQEVA